MRAPASIRRRMRPSTGSRSAGRGRRMRSQIAERLGLDTGVVAAARERVTPERLRIAELLAEAEAAERAAVDERASAEAERAEAERSSGDARERERELEVEIAAVQASAAAERARAAAERSATSPTREPSSKRCATRSARRDGTGGSEAEGARPPARRRDGAGCARRAAIRELDQPLPSPARSQPATRSRRRARCARHDPRDRGRRGRGGRRRAASASGSRSRASVRPAQRRAGAASAAVQVVARASGDVSDELDVRGQRAQEAREAVRSFVDDAALAGLPSVRVIHGRGTGAVRAAVRDELDGHPLVERHESESADGATVAQSLDG